MSRLQYRVARGDAEGTILTPHAYSDGSFVVSKTRFKADEIRERNEAKLPEWVEKGYGIRMSNPKGATSKAPSLITARSLLAQAKN